MCRVQPHAVHHTYRKYSDYASLFVTCCLPKGQKTSSLANDMSHDIAQLAGKGGKKPGQIHEGCSIAAPRASHEGATQG